MQSTALTVLFLLSMIFSRDKFRRLCRARDMLLEIPEERLSLAQIAREVEISPFHLIREFETLYGVTPHQYRIDSLLHRAKLMLASGNASVTEVCMELGFTSLGSFSYLFANRVGVSPSHYRRRARTLVVIPGQIPQQLFPGCLSLMAKLPRSAFRNFREVSSTSLR